MRSYKLLLLLLLLLGITLSFISCGGDDPVVDNRPLSERIIGTWQLVSYERKECSIPSENIVFAEANNDGCLPSHEDVPNCMNQLEFRTDGIMVHTFTGFVVQTQNIEYFIDADNQAFSLYSKDNDYTFVTLQGDTVTKSIEAGSCTEIAIYKKQ